MANEKGEPGEGDDLVGGAGDLDLGNLDHDVTGGPVTPLEEIEAIKAKERKMKKDGDIDIHLDSDYTGNLDVDLGADDGGENIEELEKEELGGDGDADDGENIKELEKKIEELERGVIDINLGDEDGGVSIDKLEKEMEEFDDKSTIEKKEVQGQKPKTRKELDENTNKIITSDPSNLKKKSSAGKSLKDLLTNAGGDGNKVVDDQIEVELTDKQEEQFEYLKGLRVKDKDAALKEASSADPIVSDIFYNWVKKQENQ